MPAQWLGECSHKGTKIRGRIAVNGDHLSRARMDEFQTCRMKCNAGDSTLSGFLSAVLAIADDHVAKG